MSSVLINMAGTLTAIQDENVKLVLVPQNSSIIPLRANCGVEPINVPVPPTLAE